MQKRKYDGSKYTRNAEFAWRMIKISYFYRVNIIPCVRYAQTRQVKLAIHVQSVEQTLVDSFLE